MDVDADGFNGKRVYLTWILGVYFLCQQKTNAQWAFDGEPHEVDVLAIGLVSLYYKPTSQPKP